MRALPTTDDPNLLAGLRGFGDAGIYRLAPDLALAQSVDFFPPVVDDPYVYGQVAAANSMSDVFAVGGRVLTALNLVAFPDDEAPLEWLEATLAGGAERLAAAGGVLVGGHSVREATIQYGLAVTGLVDPERRLGNDRARPGDVLVLTKPIGTGLALTAARAGRCPAPLLEVVIASMVRLNRAAAGAALAAGATGATDVTGFGLLGHAHELAVASGVTVALGMSKVPRFAGLGDVLDPANRSRANRSTLEHVGPDLRSSLDPDDPAMLLASDPQTSGGLLVAIEASRADGLIRRLRDDGDEAAAVVGEVHDRGDDAIVLEP